MNQYEIIMEDIHKLCNNILIEENKNSLKIFYLDNVDNNKINKFFDCNEFKNLANCNNYSNNCSCNICLNKFKDNDSVRKMLNCNHFFHKSCIDKWFIKSNTIKCPICKI